MTSLILFGGVLPWIMVVLFAMLGCWIAFQLIHQNGRLLSRLEALDQRLGPITAAQALAPPAPPLPIPAPQPAPSLPAGLPLGAPAPAFELPDLHGTRRRLADWQGQKLLLIFFNPRCGFCTQMAPDLAALPADGQDGRPIPLIVSTGEAEENRKLVEEHGIRCPVLLQEAGTHGLGGEVAGQYQCHGTPMGYVIDAQGRIASEMAVGAPALLALTGGERGHRREAVVKAGAESGVNGHAPVLTNGNGHGPLGGQRSVADSKLQRNGLAAGTPAPEFRLPLLHGGELSLEEYRGRKVLLVFSDPNCGPCDQLVPQLEPLARRTAGVQVLMVSRGDPEANGAKAAQHGLTFPIVLQRQWEISREYGMFATPIAYLIDEEGVIAADVAIGVEPILALLTGAAAGTNGKVMKPRCRCGKPPGECDCGKKVPAAAGRHFRP